jgi:hypothetical protein
MMGMDAYRLAASTAPVDRPVAERALHDVYREGGFTPPERIIWVASPVAARHYFESEEFRTLRPQAGKAIAGPLWRDSIGAGVSHRYQNTDWSVLMLGGPGCTMLLEGPEIAIDGAASENCCLGNSDACRISVYLETHFPRIPAKEELVKHCGWFYPYENVCVACERPLIFHLNGIGRMHCEDGPALVLRCGHRQFHFNGVRVTEQIICAPETLTIDQIESEPNVEVRRVMIDRFGPERFLTESIVEIIHRDDWGTLYQKAFTGDEPLTMVKVINRTAEPDGSFREYFLRVPPTMRTAREAVAWTFGKRETDYCPDIES